jgi:hypothetical protein
VPAGGINTPFESIRNIFNNGKQYISDGGGSAYNEASTSNSFVRSGLDSSDSDGATSRRGSTSTNLIGQGQLANLVPVANTQQFLQIPNQLPAVATAYATQPVNPAGVVISLNNNPQPQQVQQVPMQMAVGQAPVLNTAQFVQQYPQGVIQQQPQMQLVQAAGNPNPGQQVVQPVEGTPYVYNPQNPANVFATAAPGATDGAAFQPVTKKGKKESKVDAGDAGSDTEEAESAPDDMGAALDDKSRDVRLRIWGFVKGWVPRDVMQAINRAVDWTDRIR